MTGSALLQSRFMGIVYERIVLDLAPPRNDLSLVQTINRFRRPVGSSIRGYVAVYEVHHSLRVPSSSQAMVAWPETDVDGSGVSPDVHPSMSHSAVNTRLPFKHAPPENRHRHSQPPFFVTLRVRPVQPQLPGLTNEKSRWRGR